MRLIVSVMGKNEALQELPWWIPGYGGRYESYRIAL
jgi:hypothetical protein